MLNGIIGRKVGMTQLFAQDGTVSPGTVIKAGPCVVVQAKNTAIFADIQEATGDALGTLQGRIRAHRLRNRPQPASKA